MMKKILGMMCLVMCLVTVPCEALASERKCVGIGFGQGYFRGFSD